MRRIYADCDRLADHPRIGHAGFATGSLEWIVRKLPYIVVYEIAEAQGVLIVLGIFHGSRER